MRKAITSSLRAAGEAIQGGRTILDCFAALAMTGIVLFSFCQIAHADPYAATPAIAEPVATTPFAASIPAPNYVEIGGNYHQVSNGLGNWSGDFVNVQYQTDPANRWRASLQNEQAFHDHGVSGGLGNTHIFNEDWFSDVGVGLGSDASFLTRYRVDAAINRRLLEGRNLVATVGVSWDEAQTTYSDKALLLGATYYFPSPWIVQGYVRINDSTPGNVIAPAFTGAVTYGHNKHYYITGSYGIAREAYQLLGNDSAIVNSFTSQTFGVNWRQWEGKDWGFNVGGEYYTNPYYHRTGGIVSVFKEF